MGARRRRSGTRLARVAVAAAALTAGCDAADDVAETTSGAPNEPVATVSSPEDSAIAIALGFLDARNAWDGPAVRALVADDADVGDFAVSAPDDYLAMAVLERTLEWQYVEPECTATPEVTVTHVRCTYLMQNRLSRAAGTGPYEGSHLDIDVADGRLRRVVNTFRHDRYAVEVLGPLTDWLNTAHPGDTDVMFTTNERGEANRSLAPESLALWAERLPEYVALQATD